jgi:hypothetical protein
MPEENVSQALTVPVSETDIQLKERLQEVLINHIDNCKPREFLYNISFSKDRRTGKTNININSTDCFRMKKTHLSVIFKDINILTDKGKLQKKAFLHPESEKDYYKRNSKEDIEGKCKKILSFVVPVTKLDERLKKAILKKLNSILGNNSNKLNLILGKKSKNSNKLNSIDYDNITKQLKEKYLFNRSPDEKKQNEDLRQKINKKIQKLHPEKLGIVNSFVNKVGRLTSNQEKEISDLFTKFEKQTNTKATIVPKESSSTGENTPRIKTKGELKETSKSMSVEESTSDEDGTLEQESTTITLQQESSSTGERRQRIKTKGELKDTSKPRSKEESTSDEDGNLEQQSLPTKGKKETQKPKVSKSMQESSLTDKHTLQQESRTAKGKKLILKPTASKPTTQQKFPEGKKQTQNGKRKLKDDDSTKDKSSRKKPRLMQEQQMNENSPQLVAGKRTK